MAVLLAAASLAIAKLLRGSMEHPANLSELLDKLEPFNVACLRHIASDIDDDYLRTRLPAREYRRLRTLRLKAIRAYYRSAFSNSSLLLSYGQVLSRATDPELRAFGQQLGAAAIQLRLALIGGLTGTFFCYFMPLRIANWRQITERYENMGAQLRSLCDMHAPDLGVALSDHFSF